MTQDFYEIYTMNDSIHNPETNSQAEQKNPKSTWQGLIFGILLCIFLSLILFFIIGFRGTWM